MKMAAKPMSSPGRAEKYPPPLMRFLRSNASSKSRGRSRSSPMFIRKKNNSSVIETQQEPSSPKVTCIGQVRSKARAGRPRAPANQPCSCWRVNIKTPPLCPNLGKNLRPRSIKPDWRKWVFIFGFGYCKNSEVREESLKRDRNRMDKFVQEDVDGDEEGECEAIEAEENVEPDTVLGSTSPPKNALLLTRCRSAPHRSSSLASRFWAISETGDDNGAGRPYQQLGDSEPGGPISEADVSSRDSASIPQEKLEFEAKLGEFKGTGGSISRKSEEIAQIRAQPVALTRCKSEPARTGERLSPPDGSFWREKRD